MEKETSCFNIYCDESRVENKDSSKMVIGALIIPRSKKPKILRDLKYIYKKHTFAHELKWVKTTENYKDFYKSLIDYFIENNDIKFRCIIVNKSKVDFKKYHNSDPELAFFKFYYLMLKSRLLNNNHYYIFLDKKPTRDKNRARALCLVLRSYVLMYKNKCRVEHLQAYDSEENILIQLSDYFTGLMGHACNRKSDKKTKWEIINYLGDKLNRKNVCNSSSLAEEKFNVFCWKGKP